MSGAICLAGLSSLRSGAGLVTLAVPDVCLDTVASFEPSYMTLGLASDEEGRISASTRTVIEASAERATCLGCGPGIGRSAALNEIVGWLYQSIPQPLVLDADALHALSFRKAKRNEHVGPRILTPHAGEFRRLLGVEQLPVAACRQRAVELAAEWDVIVVLKGHQSVVTDGERTVENPTGNPGMATGGSGDVLTGVITALLGQGLTPWEAAQLGVYVHGLAGDFAAEKLGETSLIASDLLHWLPTAFQQVSSDRETHPRT